jgi:hypothetical protein
MPELSVLYLLHLKRIWCKSFRFLCRRTDGFLFPIHDEDGPGTTTALRSVVIYRTLSIVVNESMQHGMLQPYSSPATKCNAYENKIIINTS